MAKYLNPRKPKLKLEQAQNTKQTWLGIVVVVLYFWLRAKANFNWKSFGVAYFKAVLGLVCCVCVSVPRYLLAFKANTAVWWQTEIIALNMQ